MALDAFELVELHKLERGGVVGSDGYDWLRIVIGVAITFVVILSIAYLCERVLLVFLVAMLGIAATSMWTVRAGRRMVSNRIAELRSRA